MTQPISAEQTLATYRDFAQRIRHYHEAISLMNWDMRTKAPKKGRARRAEAMGTLFAEFFRLQTCDELKECLDILLEPTTLDSLDDITRASVLETKKDYEMKKNIPPDRNQAFVILTNQSRTIWEEARAKSDFSLYEPYLEQVVAFSEELVEYYGYEGHKLNALLHLSNPGVTVEQLDRIFNELRPFLVDLNKRIQAKDAPFAAMKRQPYNKAQLEAFAIFALEQMGYDFDGGRLDETVHPFEISLNLGDVRVTTKYVDDDFRPTLFGTIHEGGHAQYEQGIDPALEGTPLCNGTDSGLHESQSRFWENMIARSHAYWECYYEDFQRAFPEQTKGVSLDEFYYTINEVKPGFIRIEADEVTYNLHIMLRYELEKDLLDKKISVAELPQAWRDKVTEYLGVTPETDAEGVLQDVHWSAGGFGSFPSYSLGNVYAAQIRSAMLREIPDLEDKVRRGELLDIKKWLNDNVHRHGKMLTANEIVERISGEPVTARYLMEYLEEKFSALYGL